MVNNPSVYKKIIFLRKIKRVLLTFSVIFFTLSFFFLFSFLNEENNYETQVVENVPAMITNMHQRQKVFLIKSVVFLQGLTWLLVAINILVFRCPKCKTKLTTSLFVPKYCSKCGLKLTGDLR